MVISHFLRWIDTARVSERAAGAAALARAYVSRELPFEDRCEAEAALTFLLDDPSTKVRYALAEALAMHRLAPLQIIHALASDQDEIADLVLKRSPLFTDGDLIDRVAMGAESVQLSIAGRALVSKSVSAAIAEVGSAEACLILLRNDGADVASLSFRRMAERFGAMPRLREAMLADRRLPVDCRHVLLVKLSAALKDAPLVVALMGRARGERVMREACVRASLTLIDRTRPDEHAALVEHLRLAGELTTAFIVRMVAHGKIDFFASVLGVLAGREAVRVQALLAGGRDLALSALFRGAGLPESAHGVILRALGIWREVANGRRVAGAQEVSWLMLRELNACPGQSGPAERLAELAGLIRAIHLEVLRENARGHALAIAAA
ncbi:DUF2336 domain-containing protein [Mesorhizobium koreense]|jgi:uncharacterized protein (DUF2336 family)|uniref:DUF2336 domain-containing protein n=1 Tax=Mesorhizobium koreense TaxID=3074855 RepID=UPI00287B8B86|nr:DUF2336 domain-containing protein [Mesorhizobium sp. WR6]